MIYRVRDFAFIEGPKGDLMARPGQYLDLGDAALTFLEKTGQLHKVRAAFDKPQGASVAALPVELQSATLVTSNRVLPDAPVKRGPGRPRKNPIG